jgi:hypothetical protein
MDGGNGITRTGRTFVIYGRNYAGRSRCLTEQNRPLSPVQGRKCDLRTRNASNDPQTALDARWTKELREIFNLTYLFVTLGGQTLKMGRRKANFVVTRKPSTPRLTWLSCSRTESISTLGLQS